MKPQQMKDADEWWNHEKNVPGQGMEPQQKADVEEGWNHNKSRTRDDNIKKCSINKKGMTKTVIVI